ncbi:putative quinol monooxygenase [Streptomyces sp. NPDC057621]|uniref:putative quinol monooxygenase n=1 Tax=Streptomyces sp. NPDC057621 TaxID=3346186 RepID=UPI0036AA8B08
MLRELQSITGLARKEDGCEQFVVHTTPVQPGAFAFCERWFAAAHLLAHVSQPFTLTHRRHRGPDRGRTGAGFVRRSPLSGSRLQGGQRVGCPAAGLWDRARASGEAIWRYRCPEHGLHSRMSRPLVWWGLVVRRVDGCWQARSAGQVVCRAPCRCTRGPTVWRVPSLIRSARSIRL